jgi:hypothetical protein
VAAKNARQPTIGLMRNSAFQTLCMRAHENQGVAPVLRIFKFDGTEQCQ